MLKLKHKIILGAASSLAVLTLVACGSQKIASMKGKTITVQDFYDAAKGQTANKNLVAQMIITDVFRNEYGKLVSKKKVDEQFNATKKQLGASFETQLKGAGFTSASYRKQVEGSLAVEKGIEKNIKITNKDLKKAFKTFFPNVTVHMFSSSDKKVAEQVLKDAKVQGADFAKIVKEKSTDATAKKTGGEITFNSSSTKVPQEVKDAANKTKVDKLSAVITSTDASTYTSKYFVLKVDKKINKGNSYKRYKTQLVKDARKAEMSDQTKTKAIIAKVLKKNNVKIEDSAFADVLADYGLGGSKSSSTSSSKKKVSSSSSKKKVSSSSSKKETSSSSSTESSSSSSSSYSSSSSSSS